MYVLCIAVNAVYRCIFCVPRVYQCVVCFLFAFSSVATTVLHMLQHLLCIVQYFFVSVVHYCIVPLTSVPPTTYPHTTHTTHVCITTGCTTTVDWLLIMATVGRTHAAKYIKEATLTKPLHY